MRQAKMTARPARARRCVGAFGALWLGAAMLSPAHAMQVTPPDAATRAAMDKRTAARTLLSSALARIAANNSDPRALLDAGRASIELDDYRAALGFLVRAEQASPRDGAIKAALGSAMVHLENPTRALDYFGEAQLLGAPERLFLSDRALARDLLGQQDAAQRDYQLALAIAPNDELTRRYALSLGISGEADRAVAMLTPQLRAQDRGAWRLRAMILAINGRDGEASEIVNATMPPAMAQNILPYLTQMDRLNPAQQAAAAHFGRFPNGQLAPKRKPVQVAAAAPNAALSSSPSGKSPRAVTTPRPAAATIAAAAIAAKADPPATVSARVDPIPAATAGAAPTVEAVGPGFSIAGIGRDGAARPAGTPAAPVVSSAATAVSAPAASSNPTEAPAPLAALSSLADIAGSIEIPPEELNRPDNAIGAETLAKLLDDKRRADAADSARREKDAIAAKAKAEADAKAKADAAEKKANPARIWVQVATGANARALAFDYGKFAKKNPDLFKGKAGATAEWGKTRRLLVGPFKDRKTAQDWLTGYKKAGGDGFLFNSEAGQTVDPVQ